MKIVLIRSINCCLKRRTFKRIIIYSPFTRKKKSYFFIYFSLSFYTLFLLFLDSKISLGYHKNVKKTSYHYIETRQLNLCANQMPGFYTTIRLLPDNILWSIKSSMKKILNLTLVTQRHNQGTLQASKMENFATIVNGLKTLAIVAKLSILDVYWIPGYVSLLYHEWRQEGYLPLKNCISCKDKVKKDLGDYLNALPNFI